MKNLLLKRISFLFLLLLFTTSITQKAYCLDKDCSSNLLVKNQVLKKEDFLKKLKETTFFKIINSVLPPTKALLSSLSLVYLEIAIHEMGHFTAAKIIDPNCDTEIHYNISSLSKLNYNNLLFKLGPIHVHKEIPLYHAVVLPPNSPLAKNIPLLLAGGLTGSLFLYFVLAAKAFQLKYKQTKNFKQSLIEGFKGSLSPFKNILKTKGLTKPNLIAELIFASIIMMSIIKELLYSLTPSFISIGDGVSVWEKLLGRRISQNQIFFYTLLAYLCEVSLIYKAIKTYREYSRKYYQENQNYNEIKIETIPETQTA